MRLRGRSASSLPGVTRSESIVARDGVGPRRARGLHGRRSAGIKMRRLGPRGLWKGGRAALRRMPGLVRVRSAHTALPTARRGRQVRSLESTRPQIPPSADDRALAVYPRSIRVECSDAEGSLSEWSIIKSGAVGLTVKTDNNSMNEIERPGRRKLRGPENASSLSKLYARRIG